MQDFEQRSARREAATQRAFKDIRIVGLSIVKTLNHHTRILERIDRKLGAQGNGRSGHQDGGGAYPPAVNPYSSSITQWRGSALTKTSSPSAWWSAAAERTMS
jgi:hypothetical protein